MRRTSIVLLVVAILLCHVNCGDDSSTTGSGYDYEATSSFSFAYPVTDQIKLVLTNISGSVQIIGVRNLDTVYVTGTRRVGSSVSQADADDYLGEIQIITQNQTTLYSVETDQPQSGSQREYTVDYIIRMPSTMALDLAQTSGTVEVESIYGTANIANVTGWVNLDGLRGNTSATAVNGDLSVACTLPLGGSVSLSTVNGSISLSIPATTSAVLAATVITGAIALNDLTLDNADITEHAISGVLGTGQGSIALATTTGNIAVSGI